METGSEWPIALRNGLARSRCLVPIFSPEYFRSRWCQAELNTMLAREKLLEMRSVTNPSGMNFPIRYFDGEHFPATVNRIQQFDLRRWSYAGSATAFRSTQAFLDFTQEVQRLCQELALMILSAPEFRDDWPVVLPNDVIGEQPHFRLPRIS